MNNLLLSKLVCRVLLSLCILTSSFAVAEGRPEVAKDALNERFLEITHASLIARAKKNKPSQYKNLKSLGKDIESLNKSGEAIDALATLVSSINLIYQNIDDPLAADLTWFLYSHNVRLSADAIVNYASSHADSYSLAKIQLQRAKYFFIVGDWQGSLNTLSTIDAFSALSEADANYSYLIRGISLQRLKKHREALVFYEKISNNSHYYTVALLNSAQANIRQGWWTDAHILLRKAIAIEVENGYSAFADRLYLTLGFSLLQNEFYRDARDNFRSINLDSPYVNRAMVGIAISAMHQDDFIGALNMLKALREKDDIDPSIHEAYLLTPYVYEEIDQLRLAAANYNQAEAYFKKHSTDLEQKKAAIDANYILDMTNNSSSSLLEYTDTNVATHTASLDPLTRLNIILLGDLIRLETDKNRQILLGRLKNELVQRAMQSTKSQLEEQKQVFDSYLSQTRFALANLYDK